MFTSRALVDHVACDSSCRHLAVGCRGRQIMLGTLAGPRCGVCPIRRAPPPVPADTDRLFRGGEHAGLRRRAGRLRLGVGGRARGACFRSRCRGTQLSFVGRPRRLFFFKKLFWAVALVRVRDRASALERSYSLHWLWHVSRGLRCRSPSGFSSRTRWGSNNSDLHGALKGFVKPRPAGLVGPSS